MDKTNQWKPTPSPSADSEDDALAKRLSEIWATYRGPTEKLELTEYCRSSEMDGFAWLKWKARDQDGGPLCPETDQARELGRLRGRS